MWSTLQEPSSNALIACEHYIFLTHFHLHFTPEALAIYRDLLCLLKPKNTMIYHFTSHVGHVTPCGQKVDCERTQTQTSHNTSKDAAMPIQRTTVRPERRTASRLVICLKWCTESLLIVTGQLRPRCATHHSCWHRFDSARLRGS